MRVQTTPTMVAAFIPLMAVLGYAVSTGADGNTAAEASTPDTVEVPCFPPPCQHRPPPPKSRLLDLQEALQRGGAAAGVSAGCPRCRTSAPTGQ